MIKLSSLSDDSMLAIGDDDIIVISKSDYLLDRTYYKGNVYLAESRKASLNAKSMLEDAIENEECNNMYDGWESSIWEDIKEQDIKDIQAILDRIINNNSSANVAWHSGEMVEIDI